MLKIDSITSHLSVTRERDNCTAFVAPQAGVLCKLEPALNG
jgi:hypothetical protein